jgi:cell division protein FtsN
MRWLRENWLDALIFLLIALVAAGIVLYLTGINPFARPGAAPAPPVPQAGTAPSPQVQVPSAPPAEAKPPEPVVTVMPLPQAPVEEKPAQEARPEAASPARPKAPAPQAQVPASPGGSYRVAVGSFANPENALRLSRELSAKGYPVRLEASGSLTRVVVGPYASEAEARQVAEALKAYGAQVYRGQGAPPPAGGSLYLQVGAFQKEENALALAGKLKEMGLPVVLVRDGVYRVRVGPVPPEEKEAVKAKIAALGLAVLEVP